MNIIKAIIPHGAVVYHKQKKLSKQNKTRELAIQRIISSQKNIKLELGAGPRKGKNGWLTADLNIGCNLQIDLLQTLPFKNDSVDIIYSSHFLEHFYTHDIIKILKECLRILKPKGIIRSCVPDASSYANAYTNNTQLDHSKFLAYTPAVDNLSKMDYLNYIAYMHTEHKHLFDIDGLIEIHKKSGFSNVSQDKFDPKIDMEERKHQSIYVEAIK